MNTVLDQCGSTNEWLKEKFKSDPTLASGSWISAKHQDSGKGRQGRHWVATEGSLYLSIGFRSVPAERLTWIPLVTGIAAVHALEPWLKNRTLRLKWPNDLILNHAKLGGILCESWQSEKGADVVVGIGINGVSSPDGLDQGTAALGIAADQFRDRVRLKVTALVQAWIVGQLRSDDLNEQFQNLSYYPQGMWISWGKEGENTGRVLGLSDLGELKVQKAGGEICAVHSDEIKGLRSIQHEIQWKEKLSRSEYQILRLKGTEAPFSGEYDQHFEKGQYQCRGCGSDLFDSSAKFDSQCGWPSFDAELSDQPVVKQIDDTHGMLRVEILCARCGGHLGHLFDDGATSTGQRYCVNSASLRFKKS